MRTTWEKLVQNVGTNYGQVISNELNRKLKVNLIKPLHSTEVLVSHATHEALVRMCQSRIQSACRAQASMLRASATYYPSNAELPMKIAILDNDISKGAYDLSKKIPIYISESKNSAYVHEWRTYQKRNANLKKHRSQAHSLILGQCTQFLQDNMKQDTACSDTITSYNPLCLLQLIDETVLAQI